MEASRNVLGIDFSGSQTAGEQIWVAKGRFENPILTIEDCWSAWEEAGTKRREPVYEYLIDYILQFDRVTVGLDFPFGLPAWAIDGTDWASRVSGFSDTFSSPNEMKETCEESAKDEDHDRRRTEQGETDGTVGYGWMLKTLTYYGISAFLAEIIEHDGVSVRPMQEGNDITLIETYPAATLNRLNLNRTGYKSERPSCYETRMANLDGLAECAVDIDEDARQYAICNDDAHDAIFAAKATADAIEAGFEIDDKENYDYREGYIYV